MSTEIENGLGEISEDKVSQFEFNHSLKLPGSYRRFLLNYNGGRVRSGLFNFTNRSGDREMGEISFLFGIVNDNILSLQENIATYAERLPSDVIPIGRDSGGNLICLGVRGSEFGKVYYWLHYEEDEVADYHNLYVISEDFKQL